jgi:TonB family protein
MDGVIYFFKVQLALIVLYAFYKVLFVQGTRLSARRLFLLLAIPAALLHPLAFSWVSATESFSGAMVLDAFVTNGVAETTQNLEQNISWGIAEWAYMLITVVLLAMVLFRVGSIAFLRRKYAGVESDGYTVYSIPPHHSPASFFNMIFIPSDTHDGDRDLILQHEVVHVKQWHSLDVLFYECVKAICWLNPVVYLMDKEIRLVHEYIADSVAGNNNREAYSRALLAFNMGVSTQALTNNFYQKSTLKNRIIMLQKTTSLKSTLVRLCVIVPMFLAFSFFNSARAQTEQVTDDTVLQEVEKMPEYKGGMEGIIEYLRKEIRVPKQSEANGEEGKVFVQFIVTKNGRVKDAEVIKGVSALLDAEALRVVNGMKDWIPGENEGKPVNVQMVLPIMFRLPPPPPTDK